MYRFYPGHKKAKKICCFFCNTASIFSLVLFISLFSVLLVFVFKPLYYFDIKFLSISKNSGCSIAAIRQNYNYIIDYLTDSKLNTFSLPDFRFSEHGRIHFEEVKALYSILGILCVICGIFALFSVLRPEPCRKQVRKVSGLLLIILPVFFDLLFLSGFDKYFNLFHKIFFKNDFWLFDPYTDPVITILPEEFFMHCAVLISILMLISGLSLLYSDKIKIKQHYK